MNVIKICRAVALAVMAVFPCARLSALSVSAKLPPLEISDGEVQQGMWNSNSIAVIQKAREMHVPVLVVSAKRGCPHCARLMAAMNTDAFRAWQKKKNIFMAIHRRQKFMIVTGEATKPNNKEAIFKDMSGSGLSAPVVCVYWLKEDGTEVKRIFSGTRGNMLGQKCDKLEDELTRAVDSVIGDFKGEISQPQKPQQKEATK